MLTGEIPQYNWNEEQTKTYFTRNDDAKCSEQFANALLLGLEKRPRQRLSSVQELLNLFPGCEDIQLPNYQEE